MSNFLRKIESQVQREYRRFEDDDDNPFDARINPDNALAPPGYTPTNAENQTQLDIDASNIASNDNQENDNDNDTENLQINSNQPPKLALFDGKLNSYEACKMFIWIGLAISIMENVDFNTSTTYKPMSTVFHFLMLIELLAHIWALVGLKNNRYAYLRGYIIFIYVAIAGLIVSLIAHFYTLVVLNQMFTEMFDHWDTNKDVLRELWNNNTAVGQNSLVTNIESELARDEKILINDITGAQDSWEKTSNTTFQVPNSNGTGTHLVQSDHNKNIDSWEQFLNDLDTNASTSPQHDTFEDFEWRIEKMRELKDEINGHPSIWIYPLCRLLEIVITLVELYSVTIHVNWLKKIYGKEPWCGCFNS